MIKYLGSKRRLVPVLARLCEAADARTALDLFTGTTRVAQAFKQRRRDRHRGRHRALRRGVRAGVRRDRRGRRRPAASSRGRGRRAQRASAASRATSPTRSACGRGSSSPRTAHASTPCATPSSATTRAPARYPILLTSLIEAADRVDSTTGVQMAYVKQWAPAVVPAARRCACPSCCAGTGTAVRGDAARRRRRTLAPCRPRLPRPAVQPAPLLHELPRLGDAGRVGRARALRRGVQAHRRARPTTTKSAFNQRRAMPDALRAA